MNEKIVERIKKLMILGMKDPDSPEAKSAMDKAGKLMAKYGVDVTLDEDGNIDRDSIEERIVEVHSRWTDIWERALAHSLATAFDCKSLTLVNGRKLPSRFFMGEKNDVDLVVYFYKFIRMQIMRMGERKFDNNQERSTYGYGCVVRIDERLKQMYAKKEEVMTEDSKALMVVKKDAVDRAYNEKFPNVRKSTPKLRGSRNAFSEGYQDGDKVKMNRQVGKTSPTGAMMIGG